MKKVSLAHIKLAAIENCGLQFLLTGNYLREYKIWLKKSDAYKSKAREAARLIHPPTTDKDHDVTGGAARNVGQEAHKKEV